MKVWKSYQLVNGQKEFLAFIFPDELHVYQETRVMNGLDVVFEPFEARPLYLSFTGMLRHIEADRALELGSALYFFGCTEEHVLGKVDVATSYTADTGIEHHANPMHEWIMSLRRQGVRNHHVKLVCELFQMVYLKAKEDGRTLIRKTPDGAVSACHFRKWLADANVPVADLAVPTYMNYPGIVEWIGENNIPLVPLF